MQYHVNGTLVHEDEATINVQDRGFLYGDAAFETLRAYNGQIFEWEAHASRLRETCNALGLDHSLPSSELHDRILETLHANSLPEAYVRLSITRGVQPGKLTPAEDVSPSVVIIVKRLSKSGTAGTRPWDEPARTMITETRKIPDAAIPARLKTHNYLNGILARLELRETPADESILLTTDGQLAEGATSNVFFIEDDVLHTPSETSTILPGITRDVVIKLARSVGIPVEQGEYNSNRLTDADECFLTNTTWEIRPIRSVDSTNFETGPITETLISEFNAFVDRRYYGNNTH